MRRLLLVLSLPAVVALSSGCGRHAVRPDEKEHLADRIMRDDVDPTETAVDQHVFSNREGSAGGGAAGGGGCGCN